MKLSGISMVLVLSVLLVSCGGGNDSADNNASNNKASNTSTQSFNGMVHTLMGQTNETDEAKDVNDMTFDYDNEDETAFDAELV